jgi:hypothetical protein
VSNQFLSETVYAKTMLLMAKNQLVYGRLVDGQYRNQVNDENGLVINIKRPPRFNRNDSSALSAALAAQDILTGSTSVTVDQYAKVHVSIGDIEYVTSFNALMQNSTMKSAASTLAHQIDSFVASKTLGFSPWIAGTASGTVSGNATDPTKVIASPAQLSAARTRLFANGVPMSDIKGVVTADDGQSVRGSLIGGFIQGVNKDALSRTQIPVVGDIDWYESQQVPSITTGTRTQGNGSSTGAQVDGASQNVNYRTVKTTNSQSLLYKSLTTTMTIKKGEVFTISGVYAWDWRNNAKLDYLQQFTVLADVTSSSGAGTLSISPPIIVQGTSDGTSTDANTAFATVDSAPADSAYIQFAGALSTVLRVRTAFHKQAIALVSTPLHMPETGKAAQVHDPETGISIRYWRGSDISTGAHVHRWDCMFGAALTDPLMGTRVCGT